jgi:hypothetical protein
MIVRDSQEEGDFVEFLINGIPGGRKDASKGIKTPPI